MIIAPEIYATDLGLEWSECEYVAVPCIFPAERRPVFLNPIADVTFAKKASWPKIAARIGQLPRLYPNDRTLVHTVSYDFNRYLFEELSAAGFGHRLVTYNQARDRKQALSQARSQPASVILAPSCDRGIDLRDDDCRLNIVAKTQWPNKSDRQIARRMYQPTPREGSLWYNCQTLRTVIQMCGRGVRCFSLDTEILTTQGWKRYDQVSVGDQVYGIDPKTFTQQRPTRNGSAKLVVHEVKATVVNPPEAMIRIQAKSLDAMVTPDHAMVIQRPKQSHYEHAYVQKSSGRSYVQKDSYKHKASPLTRVNAGELPARFKVPVAGLAAGRARVRLPNNWFWLMGFIIGDGHISKTKSNITLYQSKPEVIPVIEKVLDDLGLVYTRSLKHLAGSEMTIGGKTYTRNYDGYAWTLTGHNAARVRDVFHRGNRRRYSQKRAYGNRSHVSWDEGQKIRVDGWKDVERTIPRWVIQRATVAEMRMLLDGMMISDGTWRIPGQCGSYFTSEVEIANHLQELLVLSGFRSSIDARRPGQLTVSFTENGLVDCVADECVTAAEPQASWCVNTTAGTVVMRRAGKTFIAGNSAEDW